MHRSKFYAPELDGLRFLAAFLVFVHHAPTLWVLSAVKHYGWIGVDLFLTLSAFLITRLIILEHEATGSFDLRAFFIRRALRIWPLYISYVTVFCILGVLFKNLEPKIVFSWWLSHLSFSNNILTAIHGYSPVPYTAHLWTISLEEQAYIIMPLVLMIFLISGASRRAVVGFAGAVLAVLVLSRTALTLTQAPHPFIWVQLLRADAFVLGAVAAILIRGRFNAPVYILACGVMFLTPVFLLENIQSSGMGQVFGYTFVAFGCVCVVVGVQSDGIIKTLLSHPILRYLGKISFGVYVYHLIALRISGYLLANPVGIFVVGFVLTIAFAAASYRFLESPFLKLKERHARVGSRPL